MRKPWRRKLRGCSIILLLGDTLNFALCFTSKEFLLIVFDLETGFWDGYQRAAKPNMPSLAQWQADWETRYLSGGAPPKPFCLQGNEKFVAKDNIGALKLYTESVICAPEVGPELSLAFGNRFDFKVLLTSPRSSPFQWHVEVNPNHSNPFIIKALCKHCNPAA